MLNDQIECFMNNILRTKTDELFPFDKEYLSNIQSCGLRPRDGFVIKSHASGEGKCLEVVRDCLQKCENITIESSIKTMIIDINMHPDDRDIRVAYDKTIESIGADIGKVIISGLRADCDRKDTIELSILVFISYSIIAINSALPWLKKAHLPSKFDLIDIHDELAGSDNVLAKAKKIWEKIQNKKTIFVLTSLDDDSIYINNLLHLFQSNSSIKGQHLISLAPYMPNVKGALNDMDFDALFQSVETPSSNEDEFVDYIRLGGLSIMFPFEDLSNPKITDFNTLESCLNYLRTLSVSEIILLNKKSQNMYFDHEARGGMLSKFYPIFSGFIGANWTGTTTSCNGFWFDPFQLPGYPVAFLEHMNDQDERTVFYSDMEWYNAKFLDALNSIPTKGYNGLYDYMQIGYIKLINDAATYHKMAEFQVPMVCKDIELQRQNKSLNEEVKNRKISQENTKKALDETEKLMAFIAHSTRRDIGYLESNINQSNDRHIYQTIVQSLKGEMELFALLSRDAETITAQLRQDNPQGISLYELITQVIETSMLLMLSPASRYKSSMAHRYYRYAVQKNMIDQDIDRDEWAVGKGMTDIQKHLFMDYIHVMGDSAKFMPWISSQFGNIQIDIEKNLGIEFASQGIRYAFVSAILSEFIINAFKYGSADTAKPLLKISCHQEDGRYVFSCMNHFTEEERGYDKGSSRGLAAISMLLAKANLSALQVSDAKLRFEIVCNIEKALLGG